MESTLLVLLSFLAIAIGQACDGMTTCGACFKATGCGWCVTDGKCLAGNARGPTAVNTCRGVVGNGSTKDRQNWYFSKSQIISTEAGFPVNPSKVLVYLKPGEPVPVPVEVTAPLPTDQDLDLMFVQDSSGSMADDIQTFRTLATSLVNAVLKLSKTAMTGLASFIEKPVFPQGFPPGDPKYQLADGSVRNYAYRLESSLKQSSLALQKALFKLDATSNRDLPESAFEALSQVMVCPNIGWRANARKIIVVTTDAKYHSSQDPLTWETNGVANFPGWDGQCYGTTEGTKYLREKNNYPSETQIANLFKEKNIIPIFAIAHNANDPDPTFEIDFWRRFQQNKIGFGATVALSDNSDNLIDLIVTALTKINQAITLVATDDLQKVVKNITDKNGSGTPQAPPKYDGVLPGKTVNFNVELFSPTMVPDSQVTVTSPGFGTVDITVTSTFPCKDCAGANNGQAKWDKCDECGGSNRCVGCDGVPNSGKVEDSCKVCGGANLCNVVCPVGKTDSCGVCGGTNQCVGCDGVPHSLAVKDDCGVCGGKNECVGCDGVIDSGKKLDQCGVCGGSNGCVGCDGIPHVDGSAVPVVDSCGVCGGNNDCFCDIDDPMKKKDLCGNCLREDSADFNSCVGCDGVAMSGSVYDSCGVCNGFDECVSDCDGKPWGQRRDVCGICGGTGDCVNFEGLNTSVISRVVMEKSTGLTTGQATLIGLAVAAPLTLLICAAIVAAFFIYKRMTNPYWMVPEGLLNNLNAGVADNPLYAGDNKWAQNALHE